MRPSTLPNAVTTPSAAGLSLPSGPAARPICVPCMPISKKTPSSKNAASRSRAVIFPRACCLATLSAPPISRTLGAARLELRHELTHVGTSVHRPVTSRSTAARASRRKAIRPSRASSVARHSARRSREQRERSLEVEVVLRGEGAEAEAHGDGLLLAMAPVRAFTSASSCSGGDRAVDEARARGRLRGVELLARGASSRGAAAAARGARASP